MRETWVQSLGWEDPLKKRRATHSSILTWRIPMAEKPGGLQSLGWQRVRQDCVTKHKELISQKVTIPLPLDYYNDLLLEVTIC